MLPLSIDDSNLTLDSNERSSEMGDAVRGIRIRKGEKSDEHRHTRRPVVAVAASAAAHARTVQPADIREIAITESTEILRLEAIQVADADLALCAFPTTTLRYDVAILEQIFESDNTPPGEDTDRNLLRIAPTTNG